MEEEVYRVVAKVARDTAPDMVEEIIRQMYCHNPDDWHATKEISAMCKFPDDATRFRLQDLAALQIIQKEGGQVRGRWRIAPTVVRLIKSLDVYESHKAWKRGATQAKNVSRNKKADVTANKTKLLPKKQRS